jgi:hypothetical protein
MMLTPAQFISGIDNNCPSNLGFLAYNWYTQVLWYRAIKAKQLHALSLVPVHFNLIFVLTYLGGLSAGNIYMAVILGLGTAGVIILNTVAAWTAWATNQQEGFGIYQFFFFGWRTLSPGWHKFILVWQIADSLDAFGCLVASIVIPIMLASRNKDIKDHWIAKWWARYPAIPIGAAIMMLVGFPLILWTELIVHRNHIESDTDMIAVWLFIAQVAAMLAPSCGLSFSCFNRRLKSSNLTSSGHLVSGNVVSKV